MKFKSSLFLALVLASSIQAISFRDYYYGNEALNIPSHQKEVNAEVESGILDLSEKDLTDLNSFDEVPGISRLGFLSLENNELSELAENIFHGLIRLGYLNLSGNRLSALPEKIFHDLKRLEGLNLGSNRLCSLPKDVFHGLKRLETLSLDGNCLVTLSHDIFVDLTALQDLNLASNELGQLPPDIFFNLAALKKLDLSDNQLAEFSENLVQRLPELQTLGLNNNPIPLSNEQLEMLLPDNISISFKWCFQEQMENQLFEAIKIGDSPTVLRDINFLKGRRSAFEPITISKIRNAHGENLLHAAIRVAAKRLGVVEGLSVDVPEDEKKEIKVIQALQRNEINNRYMKTIAAILACGEDCVNDMLFTPNAEGQMVIDAMFAKLGINNPITRAMLYVLSPEAEKMAKEEK